MFIFAVAAVVELIFNRIGGSLIQLTQRLLLCLSKEGGSTKLSGAGRSAALPLPPPGWPYISVKSPSNCGLRALLAAFLEEVLRCAQQRRPKYQGPVYQSGMRQNEHFFFLSWPLVQEKVKCQVAQEAEVFCSSVLG